MRNIVYQKDSDSIAYLHFMRETKPFDYFSSFFSVIKQLRNARTLEDFFCSGRVSFGVSSKYNPGKSSEAFDRDNEDEDDDEGMLFLTLAISPNIVRYGTNLPFIVTLHKLQEDK